MGIRDFPVDQGSVDIQDSRVDLPADIQGTVDCRGTVGSAGSLGTRGSVDVRGFPGTAHFQDLAVRRDLAGIQGEVDIVLSRVSQGFLGFLARVGIRAFLLPVQERLDTPVSAV